MALPFKVGPANYTRGFRSVDGPRLQMCLFGGSIDRPRPQENLRIRVRRYPCPQSTHFWISHVTAELPSQTAASSTNALKRSHNNTDTIIIMKPQVKRVKRSYNNTDTIVIMKPQVKCVKRSYNNTDTIIIVKPPGRRMDELTGLM